MINLECSVTLTVQTFGLKIHSRGIHTYTENLVEGCCILTFIYKQFFINERWSPNNLKGNICTMALLFARVTKEEACFTRVYTSVCSFSPRDSNCIRDIQPFIKLSPCGPPRLESPGIGIPSALKKINIQKIKLRTVVIKLIKASKCYELSHL